MLPCKWTERNKGDLNASQNAIKIVVYTEHFSLYHVIMCLCACAKMAASMKTIAQQPGMMERLLSEMMQCPIFTFPLRVFKWTSTFEMWFIPL